MNNQYDNNTNLLNNTTDDGTGTDTHNQPSGDNSLFGYIIMATIAYIVSYVIIMYNYVVGRLAKSFIIKILLYLNSFMVTGITLLFTFKFEATSYGPISRFILHYWYGSLGTNFSINLDTITKQQGQHFWIMFAYALIFPFIVNIYNGYKYGRKIKFLDLRKPFRTINYYLVFKEKYASQVDILNATGANGIKNKKQATTTEPKEEPFVRSENDIKATKLKIDKNTKFKINLN